MSGSPVEQHIDAVDAYARTLFLRTRQDSSLSDVADAVRQLHIALRHLRIEAADADSLLANPESIYSRQLRPLVDSCANTLGRLEDALDDGTSLTSVRSRLRGERASVDGFLDAVQLQKSKGVVRIDADQGGLEGIKDKVDIVAKRVFSRRDSGFVDDEDRVWKEFKAELENEGFSPTVLKKHKDVLRAYIRGLESMSSQNGGAPPTVRGLLEYEAESNKTALQVSSKEVVQQDIDNQKYSPTIKAQRYSHPPPVPPKELLPELESPPPLPPRLSSSSEDADDSATESSMALISTNDIMAMDRLDTGMANMHLHSPSQQHQLPSTQQGNPKYLPWHVAGSLMPPDTAELPSFSPGTSPQTAPMPIPHMGGPPHQSQSRPGLAPDRYGQEIPMNAQWTKINRDIVSPEVLQRAGVRYEARPTYVAILGRLSREQIADFARQSADCRAARAMRQRPQKRDQKADDQPYGHQRTDSKSSHEDEDESDLFDESDTTDSDDDRTSEKGTKSYPYIVSPPDKTSPAATVMPKSILKNRNENHVRFGPEPREFSRSPNSFRDERDSRRSPDQRRSQGHRERDRDGRSSNNYYYSRGGSGDSGSADRHRPRSYYDDREHSRYNRRPSHRDEQREKRNSKKKAWGQTLGAVGLGGAAVSLLSVLAEAASAV